MLLKRKYSSDTLKFNLHVMEIAFRRVDPFVPNGVMSGCGDAVKREAW